MLIGYAGARQMSDFFSGASNFGISGNQAFCCCSPRLRRLKRGITAH
jgi:hypothetical protein